MTDTATWLHYVQTEGAYLAAIESMLESDYSEIVRMSLRGQGPDGPNSFRTAIALLGRLPVSWLEENLDVLLQLGLEGSAQWVFVRPVLDTVDPGRLHTAARDLASPLISGEPGDADTFRALIYLLGDLGQAGLKDAVLETARHSADEEVRELAR